jgi:hypothetical protein
MTGFSDGYLHEATIRRRGVRSIKPASTYEPSLHDHPPVARVIKLQQVGAGGLQVFKKLEAAIVIRVGLRPRIPFLQDGMLGLLP